MRPPPTSSLGTPDHAVPPSAPEAPGRPAAPARPPARPPAGPDAEQAPDATAGTADPHDESPDRPTDDPGIRPDVRRRHRRRPAWRIGTVALLLVVVAALGGWGVHLRARTAVATHSLGSARADIRGAVGQLLTAEVDLSTTDTQRAAVTATLAHEASLLASAESQLASDRSTISAQGVDITDLSTCLTGVQEALNAVSLGDVADALTALKGVGGTCLDSEPGG
jgi:hypothetical protein